MFKRSLILALATIGLTTSLGASAGCSGSGSFQTCYDAQSGNSYNIQRYGGSTHIQGYNAGTGSSWSQTSSQIGNTTLHNGTSSSGNSWSGSSQSIGNRTYHQGVDSRGNAYNGITGRGISNCGIAGCD